MSTRCQVQVTQRGLGKWRDTLTLYHHWDGYPSNIVPHLQEARTLIGNGYESGRAGKVAGCICRTGDIVYAWEPERTNRLHSDIEYLYLLEVCNTAGGSTAEKTTWKLTIFVPTDSFWDRPKLDNMRVLWSGPIESANGQAIEKLMREEVPTP